MVAAVAVVAVVAAVAVVALRLNDAVVAAVGSGGVGISCGVGTGVGVGCDTSHILEPVHSADAVGGNGV